MDCFGCRELGLCSPVPCGEWLSGDVESPCCRTVTRALQRAAPGIISRGVLHRVLLAVVSARCIRIAFAVAMVSSVSIMWLACRMSVRFYLTGACWHRKKKSH